MVSKVTSSRFVYWCAFRSYQALEESKARCVTKARAFFCNELPHDVRRVRSARRDRCCNKLVRVRDSRAPNRGAKSVQVNYCAAVLSAYASMAANQRRLAVSARNEASMELR